MPPIVQSDKIGEVIHDCNIDRIGPIYTPVTGENEIGKNGTTSRKKATFHDLVLWLQSYNNNKPNRKKRVCTIYTLTTSMRDRVIVSRIRFRMADYITSPDSNNSILIKTGEATIHSYYLVLYVIMCLFFRWRFAVRWPLWTDHQREHDVTRTDPPDEPIWCDGDIPGHVTSHSLLHCLEYEVCTGFSKYLKC